MYLVTRGGPSFWAHSVIVAYIAKLVRKTTFYFFYGMSGHGFISDKAAIIVHRLYETLCTAVADCRTKEDGGLADEAP